MSRLRGRFSGPTDPEMDRFSSSTEIDLEMAREDIQGSKAHAIMLGETGIIPPADADRLVAALEEIEAELERGEFAPSVEHEDIHMAVESRLEERVGEVAGRLHTARSRNDQVATDVRLWLKRKLIEIDRAVVGLMQTLIDRIRVDGRIQMPGYTHLQRGQPILLGHHLLGHLWPLDRDRQRFAAAATRVDVSPLGACALAGTGLPIDRQRTADLLGFSSVADNALDAVAARDHEQEVAACCAICMTHLSRMSAELVLWSSTEFRFARLADAHSTGSSIMPQKRNPDAAELIRGKTARVYGDLMALLTLMKGLPLSYNRDLQEDRRPLFDAVGTTLACLAILTDVWSGLSLDGSRFDGELIGDDSLATELADALVGKGVPFRTAHSRVGALVLELEKTARGLDQLTSADLERFEIDLSAAEVDRLLDPAAAIERRDSHGGTAWAEVLRQVDRVQESLG